jgi:hypothetical protein
MTASVVALGSAFKVRQSKGLRSGTAWIQRIVSKTLTSQGPRLAADNLNRRGRGGGNEWAASEIVVCKMIGVRHDRITG